jgi:small subunit ribosomal protein S18
MARNPKVMKKKGQGRRLRPSPGSGRPRSGRQKVCFFCSQHATWVDYKDVGLLKRFVNDRGRIKTRGATGTCAQHQRDVATAVKTARELALLPYSVRTAGNETRGSRGGDRRGGAGPSTRGEAAASEGTGSEADAENPEDEAEDSGSAPDAEGPAEAAESPAGDAATED